MMENIQITKPEKEVGSYRFKTSHSLHEYVYSRLWSASNHGIYAQERGAISEEIATCVLVRTYWEEIRKHPSAWNGNEPGANKPGPDRLMRSRLTNEKAIFEIKWYNQPERALNEATEQVTGRFNQQRTSYLEGVRGGYIANLDWNLDSTVGTLVVRKVWPIE